MKKKGIKNALKKAKKALLPKISPKKTLITAQHKSLCLLGITALRKPQLLTSSSSLWKKEAKTLQQRGIIYERIGNYETAAKYYEQALQKHELLKDEEGMGRLQSCIDRVREKESSIKTPQDDDGDTASCTVNGSPTSSTEASTDSVIEGPKHDSTDIEVTSRSLQFEGLDVLVEQKSWSQSIWQNAGFCRTCFFTC